MNILIKGMKKPKSCYNHCEFIANKEIGCPLKDYIESHQYKNAIHPDCPLIEIVRCGECKWSYTDERDGLTWCKVHMSHYRVNADHFCSYGERRNDEGITK